MSLPLDSATAHQLAEAARAANTQALQHPAKMASYLDRNWHARAHSDLISQSLADLADGTVRRLLITTPPQIGKLCSDDTPVPTTTGWKRHGDLRVGDDVIHPSGKPTRVVAVHEPDVASMVVRTRSGAELTVHPRHEWTVYDRHRHVWDTVETQELMYGMRPGRGRGWSRNTNTWGTRPIKLRTGGDGRGGRWRFQLPWQEAFDLPDADLPVDPYTLGVWLGDGSTTKPAITHDPADVYELPYQVTSVQQHATTGVLTTSYSGLFTDLIALGVASRDYGVRSKHIPDGYLRASDEQRWDLLCGLVDSDGTITVEGQVTLSGSDQRLMYDVAELARTFGYRATVRAMPPTTSTSGIAGTKWVYIVQFTPHDGRYPGRFTRKLKGIRSGKSRTRGAVVRRRDAITGVEHCTPRPGRCITVAAADGMYLVGEHMIPTHNSTLVSEWFPFWWLARNPQHRVIVGSYGTSLANRRGRVVRRLVREHGWRYGLEMERGAASVAEWTLETGGGLKSVGVGSAVTGSPADCVAAGTLITTENGLIPAARLARMPNPPRVAAYSHPRQRFEWQPLLAVRALKAPALRELHTYGGRSLWCTPDHPVYILGKGYVPAARVKRGMELVAGTDMPGALEPRGFPLPTPDPERAVGESTRPATAPPVHHRRTETALPARVPDWVTSNTPVRNQRSGEWRTVYDFQVRDCQNFLADGILAHNCAIVDDPHKNRAEAESLVTRDKVWDWWSADITSRLAPGAPIVLVLTLWHTDDLAARVLQQDGREEHGGMWRVIRLPALADSADDPLARDWSEPLPHPKIPEGDHASARQHWDMKRSTSLVRDWHALYQCDPKPNEGALVSPELLRARRHVPPPAGVQRYGVAIDPAAGGRDLAGVIGGFLGDDSRLYVTHDSSRNGHSEQWGMEAALLAAEHDAEFVIFEKSGLFDQSVARTAFDSAWSAVERLQNGQAGEFDEDEHVRRAQQLSTLPAKPQLKFVVARKGKLLRAEPIAQQWFDDRMRTGAYLPHLEAEWTTHQVTDPESPGRIDASVYLAYEMLPIPGAEAMISVVSQLSRDQVQWEAQRRQTNASAAQPQMGARIQRAPIRPGQ